MPRSVGWIVIIAGICVVLFGLMILSGALSWFGRLPGDIHIEGERTRVFIPITSMLIISIVLSLVAYLIRRFL